MGSPKGEALVLIGGSGVGKSTQSRMSAIRWPAKRYVDVGTIREVLRADIPELELSTYGVWRLAGDKATPKNLLIGFEKYAELLWPSVVRVLKSAAREQNNLVLEGAQISPRLLAETKIEGLQMHPYLLHVSDSNTHLSRIKSSLVSGSFMEQRLVTSFPLVRVLQEYLQAECLKYGIPVIENLSFEDTQGILLGAVQMND